MKATGRGRGSALLVVIVVVAMLGIIAAGLLNIGFGRVLLYERTKSERYAQLSLTSAQRSLEACLFPYWENGAAASGQWFVGWTTLNGGPAMYSALEEPSGPGVWRYYDNARNSPASKFTPKPPGMWSLRTWPGAYSLAEYPYYYWVPNTPGHVFPRGWTPDADGAFYSHCPPGVTGFCQTSGVCLPQSRTSNYDFDNTATAPDGTCTLGYRWQPDGASTPPACPGWSAWSCSGDDCTASRASDAPAGTASSLKFKIDATWSRSAAKLSLDAQPL